MDNVVDERERDLLRGFGGTAVLVFSDRRFIGLTRRWMELARRAGHDPVVVALDDTARRSLSVDYKTLYRPVSGSSFGELTARKFETIAQVLEVGLDVVHSDADAFWTGAGDPVAEAASGNFDATFSQGTVCPPEAHDRWGFVLCTGWMHVRPTFADVLRRAVPLTLQTGNDQIALNRLLAECVEWDLPRPDGRTSWGDKSFLTWDRPVEGSTPGGLRLRLLPMRRFWRGVGEPPEGALVVHPNTNPGEGPAMAAMDRLGLWPPGT